MLSSIIFNFLASLIAVSISGSVVLHDTRLDKAFISTVASENDTTLRDFSHSLSSELHVHSNHEGLSTATNGDPAMTNRSHKKHLAVPYERMRLAALTA